jgi:hypothetical protein
MLLTINRGYWFYTINIFSGSIDILFIKIIKPKYFARVILNSYFLISAYKPISRSFCNTNLICVLYSKGSSE